MNAAELLDRLAKKGITVTDGGDEIVLALRPGRTVGSTLIHEMHRRKAGLLAELRKREMHKREIVLVAARIMHEARWSVEPPVCDFSVGRPGETCPRCGASWIEHYPEGAR